MLHKYGWFCETAALQGGSQSEPARSFSCQERDICMLETSACQISHPLPPRYPEMGAGG